ncbi:MAG: AAA family ATPase [Luteolibacter sp.]
MSLDISKLEKVRQSGGKTIARCPACAEGGGDDDGNHLFINVDGAFGCVLYQGAEGADHRKAIMAKAGATETKAPKEMSVWTALPSAPESAPFPVLRHFKYGEPSAHWIYRTEHGQIAGIVARYETAKGKETWPKSWCRDQSGVTGWQWKAMPEPRPLYGLPLTEDFVVIAEGEKCAEAILAQNIPATTWAGGSGAVTKAYWGPLKGKIAIIWPDNDQPGRNALRDLVAILSPIADEIRVVQIPEGKPIGWDAADADPQEIHDLIDNAVTIEKVVNPLIVSGVNSFPTETPPETVLLGNGWGRRGDIINFISTAGAGKSVAVTQAAMAWGLGLSYLGIHPPRPLRIILFSGEDDGVTIGQCREGFLDHSEAITGRQLAASDLAALDNMIRVDFSREYVGERFHGHLTALLQESPADLIIVNPLLSYVGGEIVACASQWLRAGLMPILQTNDCGALISHHTGKMAKDGWDNTDDTYSAIGGGEMANVPRSILTLRPTAADGLSVVKVSKRQTTGWKDEDDQFTSSFFVRRSNNPERPAWIPVAHDEAEEEIAAGSPSARGKAGGKKATAEHVVEILKTGAMQRQQLIERMRKTCSCSDRPAKDAIKDAEDDELIASFTEPNPNGGHPLRWFCLPEQKGQWVK